MIKIVPALLVIQTSRKTREDVIRDTQSVYFSLNFDRRCPSVNANFRFSGSFIIF